MRVAMRLRPETCEENAAMCRALAAETNIRDLRYIYLDLASQWLELAETVRLLQDEQPAAALVGHERKAD